MKNIITLVIILIATLSFAQDTLQQNEPKSQDGIEEDTVFEFYMLEEKPEFPGGDAALMKFVNDNVKYPHLARENNIEGKVFVKFVIDITGKVINVEVARSIDPILDKEALRVINLMPDWKSGNHKGRPVKVSYSIPINFRLMKKTNKKRR